jgi:hypothetical protein
VNAAQFLVKLRAARRESIVAESMTHTTSGVYE